MDETFFHPFSIEHVALSDCYRSAWWILQRKEDDNPQPHVVEISSQGASLAMPVAIGSD